MSKQAEGRHAEGRGKCGKKSVSKGITLIPLLAKHMIGILDNICEE